MLFNFLQWKYNYVTAIRVLLFDNRKSVFIIDNSCLVSLCDIHTRRTYPNIYSMVPHEFSLPEGHFSPPALGTRCVKLLVQLAYLGIRYHNNLTTRGSENALN
jgi:hypothetical protein